MRSANDMDRQNSRPLGAFYVALGQPACEAAKASIASLRHVLPDMRIKIVSDQVWHDCEYELAVDSDPGGRSIKTRLFDYIPTDWNAALYLDADTLVYNDPSVGFSLLNDGWDIVLTHSKQQGQSVLWHVDGEEYDCTLDEWGSTPLQYQAGVMFIARNERTVEFFRLWHAEWLRWGGQDQAAFLRAYRQSSIKLWLLGRPFNGGAVISHFFGRARAGAQARITRASSPNR